MQPYEIAFIKRPTPLPPAVLLNPNITADYVRKNLIPSEEWKEHCYALTLDKSNNLIGVYHVSSGSGNQTTFDKKAIVKAVLDSMCTGVILVHNHPSGNPKPGQHDIRETDDIRKALKVFDTSLTDHIVLGEDSFFSFNEEITIKYA